MPLAIANNAEGPIVKRQKRGDAAAARGKQGGSRIFTPFRVC